MQRATDNNKKKETTKKRVHANEVGFTASDAAGQ